MVGIALEARLLLDPVLGERVPFLTLFAVLLPLVILVRPGPFLVAAIASCVGAVLLFIPPRFHPDLSDPVTQLQVVLLALAAMIATITAWLAERAQGRARHAEHELGDSEERLRALVNVITDVPWVTDAVGEFVEPQPAWEQFTGQTWEQHKGFGWADALHPDDREQVKAIWRKACDSKTLYESRGRLWHAPTRGYRYFVARATPLVKAGGSGQVRAWVGSCTDVHEAVDREQAIRDSEERYRTLFNVSIYGVITIDENGIIESANPAAERLFGYSVKELLGRNVDTLMPEPYKREHASYLDNYRSTGVRKIIGIGREVIGLRKDGSQFPMDLAVAEFSIAEKRYFKGIVHDITERKQAEEALRASEERYRLIALNREFLANELTHRVKNTLTTVQAIAAQTRRFSQSPEEFDVKFGERLTMLGRVHGLLARGNWENALIDEIVRSTLAPHAQYTNGGVLIEGSEMTLPAKHALAMSMILHELTTNAVKHGSLSKPDGKVRIAWLRNDGVMSFSWREKDGPAVGPPTREGFGSTLIGRIISYELEGTGGLTYNGDGLACEFEFPIHQGAISGQPLRDQPPATRDT